MKKDIPHSEEDILNTVSDLIPPFERDSDAIAKRRVMNAIGQAETKREGAVGYGWIYRAAAIALIVGIGSFFLLYQNQTVKNKGEEPLVYELPCKTEVALYPGAELSYNSFTYAFMRKVNLRGRAFFEVAHGAPFTAFAAQCKVKVLGTAFDVWAGDSKSFVHCHSGVVQVVAEREMTRLETSEFVRISDGKTGEKQSYSLPNFKPGTNESLLRFENAPIELVIAHLERAHQIEIDCGISPSLRYTGELNATAGLDQSLRVFCKPFGASYRVLESGRITITP